MFGNVTDLEGLHVTGNYRTEHMILTHLDIANEVMLIEHRSYKVLEP